MVKCKKCGVLFDRLNMGEYSEFDNIHKTDTVHICNQCLIKEEIRDLVNKVFEEKAKDYELKSGDILPLQQKEVDDCCDKIGAIIYAWINQN